MSKLELVRGLYDYNEWANNHVLKTASGLSEEEFSRAQGASFESVEGNLAHIMGAQAVWLARWQTGANPAPITELQSVRGYPATELAFALSHAGLREFTASLTDADMDKVLHYTDIRGNPHARPLWQLMVHVVNHGTHHRAETAMALTAMGQAPAQLDYVYFELARGTG